KLSVYSTLQFKTLYIIVVKRLQRGVHAVAAGRAGVRQGMLSHITALYLIPALPHYNYNSILPKVFTRSAFLLIYWHR
ncbi:hypothetical protein, partial [Dorea sp. D27]|uniref:hypothetical protein n=1 Tax=Dorea sp. D27 TaxID=658665 RepID=UPI001A9A2CB1